MWRALGEGLLAESDPLSNGSPRYWIPIPSMALREASSVADLGFWYAIGEAWSHIIARRLPSPDASILDLGCGSGKMARFLSILPDVTYTGIDVFKPAIMWCKAAFLPLPNFQFIHFDVFSPLYNHGGTIDLATAALPTEDRFDAIICASLFTHLPEPAFRHYLGELWRCLSDRGVAFVSIHNEPADGRFSGKETRIDISNRYFAELASEAKLTVQEHVGNVFSQELFILARNSSPDR